jgi:uncharacterized damage-inducible protein DinB
VTPRTPPKRATPDTIVSAWQTSCRATAHLIAQIPRPLWAAPVPGTGRRTIRTIAAHLHNSRCAWITTLGLEHGIRAPARVDRLRATQRQVGAALKRSEQGIAAILELGLANGGSVPPSRRYVWRNLALDVGHVLTYFVAHEAHHRGQLLLVLRQLDHRLPADLTGALWQWKPLKLHL